VEGEDSDTVIKAVQALQFLSQLMNLSNKPCILLGTARPKKQAVLSTLDIETSAFLTLSKLFFIMKRYGWNGIAQRLSVEISNIEFQQNKHYEIYWRVHLWPYVN
jgi:hypothetical protein